MQLRSIVQCPHCGFKVTERMSMTGARREWRCPACEQLVQVSTAECCVFCRYGTVRCPAQQSEKPR